MSASDPNTESDTVDYRSFTGETYGQAVGFDETTGEFKRNPRGSIRILNGPRMVADELIRTLRTPVGDDPLRPDLGLDRRKLLGTTDALAKQAIIEAIGPQADPRVAQLDPPDIEITRPGNNREDTTITVTATLADGTPVEFSAAFRALLGSQNFDAARRRQAQRDREVEQ